jgi:hypothetical protein
MSGFVLFGIKAMPQNQNACIKKDSFEKIHFIDPTESMQKWQTYCLMNSAKWYNGSRQKCFLMISAKVFLMNSVKWNSAICKSLLPPAPNRKRKKDFELSRSVITGTGSVSQNRPKGLQTSPNVEPYILRFFAVE